MLKVLRTEKSLGNPQQEESRTEMSGYFYVRKTPAGDFYNNPRLNHALNWCKNSSHFSDILVSRKEVRQESVFTEIVKLYILYALAIYRGQEIKCEICNIYEGLEFHHEKYYPEKITIDDIAIRCCECHRNTGMEYNESKIRTVFENGKRYCEMNHYKFEY